MSETKFTPGPWETDFFNVEDQGVYMVRDSLNQAVCQCFTQYPFAGKPGITDDEAEANANLIAAAPELYEALRGVVQEACGTCAMMHVNPETYDFIENGCPYTENNEKCDYRNCIKILRKARGEE